VTGARGHESSLSEPTVIGADVNQRTIARAAPDGRTEIVRVLDVQNQKRHPNFERSGVAYLIRCFTCGPERGTENYGPMVATGQCAWCGDTYDNGAAA
jgi:hypothetical protein